MGTSGWDQPSVTRPRADLLPFRPCGCPWSRECSRRSPMLVLGPSDQTEGHFGSAPSHWARHWDRSLGQTLWIPRHIMRTWKERPVALGPTAPQGQTNARGSRYLFELRKTWQVHTVVPIVPCWALRDLPQVSTVEPVWGLGTGSNGSKNPVCVRLHHERRRRAKHQSAPLLVPASRAGSSLLFLLCLLHSALCLRAPEGSPALCLPTGFDQREAR